MKHSNTTIIICLLIGFFSFNSFSLNTMSQLFAAAKRAAQEDGHNIDYKTCDDDGGGFNPDHVHKADMSDSCDENSKVVKRYKNNLVFISGKNKEGRAIGGTGFLSKNCSIIISANHNLYEKNKFNKSTDSYLTDLKYAKLASSEPPVKIDRNDISEAGWQQTRAIQDDFMKIKTSNSNRNCSRVNTFRDMNEEQAKSLANKKMKFHILKYNTDNGKICSQQCNLVFENVQKPSLNSDLLAGIQNDCKFEPGNSGSPVFVEDGQGELYLLGIQTAYDGPKNFLTPISDKNLPGVGD